MPTGDSILRTARALGQKWTSHGLHKKMSRNDVQAIQSEENVEMKNDDEEFNCQLWLTFALQYLVKRNWITEDEFTSVVSKVDDYVIEPEIELMEDGYE